MAKGCAPWAVSECGDGGILPRICWELSVAVVCYFVISSTEGIQETVIGLSDLWSA